MNDLCKSIEVVNILLASKLITDKIEVIVQIVHNSEKYVPM